MCHGINAPPNPENYAYIGDYLADLAIYEAKNMNHASVVCRETAIPA